jgi:hypothetical protein
VWSIIAATFISIRRRHDRRLTDEAGQDAIRRSKLEDFKMRRLVLLTALLIVSSAATAQNNTPGSSMKPSRPIPEAPIGHRQPSRDMVPSEKNLSDPNSQANREDAALDRKIKSICRGC